MLHTIDTRPVVRPDVVTPAPHADRPDTSGEDGSLVSEYGLLAVLGATMTGLAISWAKGGAVATLLTAVLRHVRQLVGA